MTEFTVTGIRYQMGEHLSYEEKDVAAKEFVASLKIGQPVLLVFEPDNPGSPNKAIAVYIDYERIGYIADEQCDLVHPLLNEQNRGRGTIVRKDDNVTFFITIPGASENQKVTTPRERVLPDSPLGDSFRMPYTKDENALQLIASTLSEMEVNMDNLPEMMLLAKRYVPLAKISICYDDNLWRSLILRKLEQFLDNRQQLGMSADDTKEMEVYCKQVRDAVGDMHRSVEHWPEKVFVKHLETLRENENLSGYLYKKYCETFLDCKDFSEADKNKIASEYDRLCGWMKGLKWSDLRNPRNLRAMGFRVNYLGLSRQELYDLYSVLLLIEKLESVYHGNRQPDIKHTLTPNRQSIYNQLLAFVDKGDWKSDEIGDGVRQMLRTILGLGETLLSGNEAELSEKLWNLLESGRGERLRVTWQNMIGYYDDRHLLKQKSAPMLNLDFFGDKEGSDNINKGRPSRENMSSGFREVLPLLDAYVPKSDKPRF